MSWVIDTLYGYYQQNGGSFDFIQNDIEASPFCEDHAIEIVKSLEAGLGRLFTPPLIVMQDMDDQVGECIICARKRNEQEG